MQSDHKLTSRNEMTPPSRRGGRGGGARGERGSEGGDGAKAAGRGRGRGGGGGGRGSRGGPSGAGAGFVEGAAAATPSPLSENARNAKSMSDRPKNNSHAKASGGGSRGGRGGSSGPSSRPPRSATVSLIARKVLVRNIPHDWDEEKLVELVESYGVTKQHIWRFVQGKIRSNNRAPRPARLYLDFKKDTELASSVIDKLNGYVASDEKDPGPTKLDVAFAPFQKIPREKQRKDTKVGTIDRDGDFMAFLEELAKPKEKLPSADLVADAKDTEATEKPVAALVQYLNERKRDRKSKFTSKSIEKTRGSRAKAAKEGKGTKEKTKGVKGRSSKTSDALSTKDTAKPRKTRGKTPPALKEKTGDSESVAPGALKIMSSKARENVDTGGSDASVAAATSKTRAGKRESGSSKPSRRNGQQTPKVNSGSNGVAAVDTAAPASTGKEGGRSGAAAGGRGRRDNRSSKSAKSGGGRGDQPKKVFVPKATTPAG